MDAYGGVYAVKPLDILAIFATFWLATKLVRYFSPPHDANKLKSR